MIHDGAGKIFDGQSMEIGAFREGPVVLSREAQLKIAYDMAPRGALALEFGVYKGNSISVLAHANRKRHFVGFDSFQGLPEAWHRSETDSYGAGHFALPELPTVPDNVTLVPGFFDATLEGWLAEHPGQVGFVHMDADLYSSCIYVMDRLASRLTDGAVIVFDELCDWQDSGVYPKWPEGEWQALRDWLNRTGYCFRILSRADKYEAAIQVFRSPPRPLALAAKLRFLVSMHTHGHMDEAIAQLFPLCRALPHWGAGGVKLAQWLQKAYRPVEALEILEALRRERAEPAPWTHQREILICAARCFNMLKDWPNMRREIDALLLEEPDAPQGLRLLCKAQTAVYDYEGALASLQRLFRLSGDRKLQDELRAAKILCGIKPRYRPLRGGYLVQHIANARDCTTVLDIGSGAGEQAAMLRAAGKQVTELDYGSSHYFVEAEREKGPDADLLLGDFMQLEIARTFDCVLASHVLEHQLDVNAFLRKAHGVLREGGLMGVTVPPLKTQIVGGHLTLWNAGLLLYNLVLAGFDCREPWIRRYGYNISVAVRKRSIQPEGLVYDSGDIDRIAAFLPEGFGEGFDGDIWSHG